MESIAGWFPKGKIEELCKKYNIQGKTQSEKMRNLIDYYEQHKATNQLTLDECLDKLEFDFAVLAMAFRELKEFLPKSEDTPQPTAPEILTLPEPLITK